MSEGRPERRSHAAGNPGMERSGEQMHLGVFAVGTGNHIAGWRYPGASKSSEDFPAFHRIAQSAERGHFDFLFVADNVACSPDDHPGMVARLEPFTLLAALGAVTTRLGLIGTASTTYSQPYNLARRIASLDHLSGGRAGWNVVTTSTPESATNFGLRELAAHDLRYRRADEFLEVVKGLWDSWESGARVADPESGTYVDPRRIHRLDHRGEFYSVRGPLNSSRCPQGQPVIVQAGASKSGQAFAARHAEALFTVQQDLDAARDAYESMKTQAAAQGRDGRHLKILPGLLPIVGRSEREAREKLDTLTRYVDDESAMRTMSDRLGRDMSRFPLDGPVPDLPRSERIQGYSDVLVTRARRAGHTLRDLYHLFAVARGYAMACGSPEQVADMMEEWFRGRACDGFILVPAHFPEAFDDFVRDVVPLLQARGLLRAGYGGRTLREHLGLPVPENRHTRRRERTRRAG